METLAYLHVAQDFENPEEKELNLNGLKSKAAIGVLGAAVAVGALGVVDTAPAHAWGGYGYGGGWGCGGYSCYRPVYVRCYQPVYVPVYPCYRPCYRGCW